MSSSSGTNGPADPGYRSDLPTGSPWSAADAFSDTGPLPRQAAAPGAGPASRGGRQPVDVVKLLGVVVAALGGLNFIWGFLPELTAARSQGSLSVFAVGPAYVPVLLLIGGLLALATVLPGREVSRVVVAAVSVGGAAGAIVSLGTQGAVQLVSASQVSKGMGAILLVIFGIIQAVVAIGAYVVGADAPPWFRSRHPVSGSVGPIASAGPHSGRPAGDGWGTGGGYGSNVPGGGYGPSAPGGGYGPGAPGSLGAAVAPEAVQPGWFGASSWASNDPRNAPADERPTGPQQIVVGTESPDEPPPVTPNHPGGSVGRVDVTKDAAAGPAGSTAGAANRPNDGPSDGRS